MCDSCPTPDDTQGVWGEEFGWPETDGGGTVVGGREMRELVSDLFVWKRTVSWSLFVGLLLLVWKWRWGVS